MQSLRDKLLKAGLVKEDEARRAEAESRRAPAPAAARPASRPASRPGRTPELGAPIPKLPPLAVPNNKEFQRLESKRQVELDRRIRELVQGAQVEPKVGGHTFHFVTRKNRLRRMELTDELAARLERGELAVVERPEPGQIDHALVPAAVAEQVLQLQERSVRFFNREGSPVGFISDDELAQRQEREAAAPDAAAEAGPDAAPAEQPSPVPAEEPEAT